MRRWFSPLLDNEPAGGGGAPAPAAPVASDSAPAPTGGTPAATPAAKADASSPELFTVKVDGEEVQLTKQQLLQYASLGKAGHKRMAEAAEKSRRAETFIENVRKDPMKALLDPALGLTKAQIKEQMEKWYKAEVIDEEAMTDEQRKLRDYERRFKEIDEKESKEKESKETERQAAIETHWQGNFQKQIIETMDKSGIPRTPHAVGRFAFYMAESVRAGEKNIPMDVIADKVREDYQTQLRAFTQQASPEVLLKFLGAELANKIRKHDVETLVRRRSGAAPALETTPSEPEDKKPREAKKKPTWASVRRSLGR